MTLVTLQKVLIGSICLGLDTKVIKPLITQATFDNWYLLAYLCVVVIDEARLPRSSLS
jgi:hypothetical protein